MTQPTPGLSQQQAQEARFIYQRATQRGLPAERAKELAAAAYSESSLNPSAKNPSGAGGLFQLLSSGYVNAANREGGVLDPGANEDAILPAYESYWQQHPDAAPGEAAAAVEASGEGAGFYSKGLGLLGFLGGGAPAPSAGAGPAPAGAAPMYAPAGPDPQQRFRSQLAELVGSGGHVTPREVLSMVLQRSQAAQPAPATIAAGGGYGSSSSSAPAAPAASGGSTVIPVVKGDGIKWSGATLKGEAPQFVQDVAAAAAARGATGIRVIDGARAEAHNRAAGGVQNSNHLPDAQGLSHAMDAQAYVPGHGWVPLGALLSSNAGHFGLRSGDQPGFFNGRPDVNHVDDGYNQHPH